MRAGIFQKDMLRYAQVWKTVTAPFSENPEHSYCGNKKKKLGFVSEHQRPSQNSTLKTHSHINSSNISNKH